MAGNQSFAAGTHTLPRVIDEKHGGRTSSDDPAPAPTATVSVPRKMLTTLHAPRHNNAPPMASEHFQERAMLRHRSIATACARNHHTPAHQHAHTAFTSQHPNGEEAARQRSNRDTQQQANLVLASQYTLCAGKRCRAAAALATDAPTPPLTLNGNRFASCDNTTQQHDAGGEERATTQQDSCSRAIERDDCAGMPRGRRWRVRRAPAEEKRRHNVQKRPSDPRYPPSLLMARRRAVCGRSSR